MATSVAAPLEHQFTRIAGVTEMTSTSMLGSANITLQFDLSRDIDGAARDVQAAIMAARSDLPTTLPNSPTYRKINPADAPIMVLSLTSETLDPAHVFELADSIIGQRLSQVEGVSQVMLNGAEKAAVRVQVNPGELAARGLQLADVRSAIAAASVNGPKGSFDGPIRSVLMDPAGVTAGTYLAQSERLPEQAEVIDRKPELRREALGRARVVAPGHVPRAGTGLRTRARRCSRPRPGPCGSAPHPRRRSRSRTPPRGS